ncbi:MAG: glucose-6-phosphate isomerase [Bacteroidales bacterium]|nr:glucose-6-phosphate isomerase [Bacteroidales bacterium]
MIKVYAAAQQSALDRAVEALELLESKNGLGNDFLGWLDLPEQTPESIISECEQVAENWKKKGVRVVVVIGIGGSYLGAKCAIEALSHSFSADVEPQKCRVVFAGYNLSQEYHSELLDFIADKSVACVVISKSGTTTEPAVAFRIIKEHIENRYGKEEAAQRIVAVTDSSRGALKTLSDGEGYKTFVIPDNVGGRFSVLTPVGLLPILLAGFDIRKMLKGAADMARVSAERSYENPAVLYAAARNELYEQGKKIEILVNYAPKLQYVGEWWKQLYGESEGKDGKGIFPASVNFTTDLHSMGQYIQDGERILFETVLSVANASRELKINNDSSDLDGLNFLAGTDMEHCNKMAELGTRIAHIDGGVPNLRIEIDRIDEYNLGELFFFFEKACGVSAYMLGVNPFDQPGVEAYKKNMFALLDKPGYEEESKKIRELL